MSHRDELYHHGIKGMKWGVRRFQNKNDTLTAAGKKRRSVESDDAKKQSAEERAKKLADIKQKVGRGAKATAKVMGKLAKCTLKVAKPIAKKGFEAANKAYKKISKLTVSAAKKIAENRRKKKMSDDARTARKISRKSVKSMSNAELRKLNERTQLETQYKSLHPSAIQRGLRFVTTTAAVTGTVLTLYNNSNKLVSLGEKFAKRMR